MTEEAAIHKIEEFDNETGELTQIFTAPNSETGEEEVIYYAAPPREKRFKIPPSNITTLTPPTVTKLAPFSISSKYSAAILYFLPTTIFFSPILALLIVIMEVMLHVWAHRKNKILMDNDYIFEYRSPLHVICKEFCGACKEENCKMKITKMQDKMHDRFKKYGLEYVRRIV